MTNKGIVRAFIAAGPASKAVTGPQAREVARELVASGGGPELARTLLSSPEARDVALSLTAAEPGHEALRYLVRSRPGLELFAALAGGDACGREMALSLIPSEAGEKVVHYLAVSGDGLEVVRFTRGKGQYQKLAQSLAESTEGPELALSLASSGRGSQLVRSLAIGADNEQSRPETNNPEEESWNRFLADFSTGLAWAELVSDNYGLVHSLLARPEREQLASLAEGTYGEHLARYLSEQPKGQKLFRALSERPKGMGVDPELDCALVNAAALVHVVRVSALAVSVTAIVFAKGQLEVIGK